MFCYGVQRRARAAPPPLVTAAQHNAIAQPHARLLLKANESTPARPPVCVGETTPQKVRGANIDVDRLYTIGAAASEMKDPLVL